MAARKKAGTEVAPKGGALATRAPGRGFEEADSDSFAIPFLALLQKGSPHADPDDELYVKGAKAGMFINTVTLELFEKPIIIPCVFQRRFQRWAPRDSGGGFKGTFMPSVVPGMEQSGTIKQDEEGRWYFAMPDGTVNEKKCDVLTDTRLHFCLHVGTKVRPVLVSLSRTQLRKSKQWMAFMQERGGDMFGAAYTCTSKDEENDKGKWKGWNIVLTRDTTADELKVAEAFYASVAAGKVQVKMDQSHDE